MCELLCKYSLHNNEAIITHSRNLIGLSNNFIVLLWLKIKVLLYVAIGSVFKFGSLHSGSLAGLFDEFPDSMDSGPIHLTDLDCNGNESSLLDCPVLPGPGLGECGSNTDTSVQCAGICIF